MCYGVVRARLYVYIYVCISTVGGNDGASTWCTYLYILHTQWRCAPASNAGDTTLYPFVIHYKQTRVSTVLQVSLCI